MVFHNQSDASGTTPRLKPLSAFVLSSLASWQGIVHAEATTATQVAQAQFAQVEFDNGFLDNGKSSRVDLSRFERGNIVNPGVYNVDLYVGDAWIGRLDVPFNAAPGTRDAQPCFDESLLRRIGLDLGKLAPELTKQITLEKACFRIGQLVPEASAGFDFSEQRLTLSIPQASMKRAARGYVSPDQWTSGVTAGMLGYNANLYTSKVQGGNADTNAYVGLNAGFNAGNWHFRHNGSYTWDSKKGSRYQNISTYVARDIPSLSSQLVIGETHTTGELFDSTQFRGVRLSTDDRMLPESLRGYAPVVRGVANSNAKVSIRQNGVLIHETTVSPGAFEIDDLYPTGYGGDLMVSVTEADGSVHTFSIPYAAVPLSLRPGLNRYSFVAGTVRNQQSSSNPLFTQATWQRGLTNMVTGYGGVTIAEGYGAVMLGAALNTALGAVGVDVTQAATVIPGSKRFTGSSMRISYSKSLEQTGTNLALAAYRYSTSGYFGLNDAMLARETARERGTIDLVWRQRNRASLTLNQNLGERRGQLNVTASASDYWNRSGSDVSYSVGYNNAFRNISYSVQATRQRTFGGQASTLYYASVTIPLGKTNSWVVSGNVTHDTNGQTQVQSSLYGSTGVDNNLSYSLTANHSSGSGSTSADGSASVTYRGSRAEVNASAGAGTDYQQGSIGIRGALVAHPGGLTLSQPVSDTFGIVEAPGATDARVTNASGVRVDGRGYAIVPFLTPYSLNRIDLDPKGLSTDVELLETSQQIAPRAGAIPLLKFGTVTGRSAVIQARLADGTPLPFGAAVVDETGKDLGVVAQASKIFARGLQEQGELTVKWGEDARSTCRIRYDLPVRKGRGKSAGFEQITGMCVPTASMANK
ncbi:fimbria/pilus outer membrane usher protein [Burkholderia sp. Ac-20353]|uniref:fimbria/pilus outer membrane usher protein n=1 Tax=Burkholderia sp. Ac-20353 TaxID=2703894 RepID=UPI00197B8981|nr:fimbria/pilus outer membrane usher protein [Burkholderia sp. Ac-20353]MBN3787639.1 fimbrial biogenesis outer membrane usher protein [Burkholderia sp. Ac-20353]